MKTLESKLKQAIEYRSQMTLASNAMRLVNGAGDGLEGLLIDRYNRHLHVQFLVDNWYQQKSEITRV